MADASCRAIALGMRFGDTDEPRRSGASSTEYYTTLYLGLYRDFVESFSNEIGTRAARGDLQDLRGRLR